MAIFGHYLTPDGLKKIKEYKYQSGDYTVLDKSLDHFWNFVVQYVPMWFAPNVLTLLGFLSSLVAFTITMVYAPNLIETLPSCACFIIAASVFLYQTFDAIDGKQARRTGTSSPLGTLFDHGCDIITGTTLAISTVALCRCGSGLGPFMAITVSAQLLQFLYLWWEYHFHVFFSNPGYGTGVTEAQLGIMIFASLSGIFGGDFWLADISRYIPPIILSILRKFIPSQLFQLNYLVMWLIIINNISSAFYIVISGFLKMPSHQRFKSLIQSFSFIGFLLFEWFFYYSTILRFGMWPPFALLVITVSYSTICIRILLSSTSRRPYHSLQWPVAPFCIVAFLMYFSPYFSLRFATFIEEYRFEIIAAVFCWQICYILDLLLTSINDICAALGVRCFIIPNKLQQKKN